MLKEKNTKPHPTMPEESSSYYKRKKKNNEFGTVNDERGNVFGNQR